MELRTYIEKFTQYEEGLSLREKIEIGRQYLFDFYYPFYDEDYRQVFETNFIKNFYMREIGFETEELFKLRLDTWLNINMTYYNELLASKMIEYNPLFNTEVIIERDKQKDKTSEDLRSGITETENTGSEKISGESSSSEDRKGFNRKLKSDTPDGRLRLTGNSDGSGVIEYASEIEENLDNDSIKQSAESKSSGSVSNEGKITSNEDLNRIENEIEDFKEVRKGKIGQQSYASMINEYRSTLLRIEKQIFEEMNELFMLVY